MDLNDLRYFALIVDHGGFSAAERITRITKSKLGRRVSLLEERMGVRLIQRSTRRLWLTEAGRAFYEHCAAMLVEAEAAHQAVEQLRSAPAGTARMTCPVPIAQFYVAGIVAEFMRLHPKVRVEIESTDRLVHLIGGGRGRRGHCAAAAAHRLARAGGWLAAAHRERLGHRRAGDPSCLCQPPRHASSRAGG